MFRNSVVGAGGTGSLGALLLSGLLLLSVAVAPVAAASSDAGAGTPSVGFADAVISDQRGDVAAISLRLRGASEATLSIRAANGAYQSRVGVRDGDGDGNVTIQFNTFRAGWRSDERAVFSTAGEGDWITSAERTSSRRSAPIDVGRYNLIASTQRSSTSAVLELTPGSMDAATATVVADEHLPSGAVGNVTPANTFETDVVAEGDYAVVAFNASGVEGQLAGDVPGRNLLYPRDSSPGADTTHTVQVSPDRSVSFRTVSVNYAGVDGGTPTGLSSFGTDDVTHVGIDRDGDGVAETDLTSSLARIRSNTAGQISLTLSGTVEVAAGETLLVQYAATNPAKTGADSVAVSLGDAYRAQGTAVYGPAGQGTLGYGLDLRLTATDGDDVVAPLPVDYGFASDSDTLYALVDTTALYDGDSREFELTLSRSAVNPVVESDDGTGTLDATFTVTDRRATLVSPSGSEPLVVSPGNVTFEATTTLAPESTVVVRISSGGDTGFLLRTVSTVDADRSIEATMTVPNYSDEQSFELTVEDDDRTIGGPYDGVVRNDSTAAAADTTVFGWART
ncbi:MAG: hypothetical protein ABEJ78_00635 [Haloferacaceae archaeon]